MCHVQSENKNIIFLIVFKKVTIKQINDYKSLEDNHIKRNAQTKYMFCITKYSTRKTNMCK